MNTLIKVSIKIALLSVIFFSFISTSFVALAEEMGPPKPNSVELKDNLRALGDTAGYITEGVDEFTLAEQIGKYISVFLSILGIIFIILVIYAGYNWMTAMGDSGKADKAKDTLWRAVIGLIIIVGTYAIWEFILIRVLAT